MKRQLDRQGQRYASSCIRLLVLLALGGAGWAQPATVTPAPEREPKALKPLSVPLPVGQKAREIKIPQFNLTGQILSQLLAGQVQRMDDEFLQIKELKLDLYDDRGNSEFRIDMPASIFSTKTRVITSEDPVFIHHRDFDLTGRKLEFDTATRKGRLLGPVTMKIRDVERITTKDAPVPAATVPPAK